MLIFVFKFLENYNFKSLKMKTVSILLFFFAIQLKNIENTIIKVLRSNNVSANFSSLYLINSFSTRDKVYCINYCEISSLCSTAIYTKSNECSLFNRLAYSGDLVSSFDSDVFVKYPRSCKQIKTFNPQTQNGLYDIDTPNGQVTVYCEFLLDQEGFTFLQRSSLDVADNNFLKDIYLNQSIVLMKIYLSSQLNQPFIFIQQLDVYSYQPIVITINQGYRYYSGTSSKYFKISLVDENKNCQINQLSGFKANGNRLTYQYNADSNGNRYFVFYQTFFNFYDWSTCYLVNLFSNFIQYKNDSITNSNLPLSFFYTTEFYMGNNGFLLLSNCNQFSAIYAYAFGLK